MTERQQLEAQLAKIKTDRDRAFVRFKNRMTYEAPEINSAFDILRLPAKAFRQFEAAEWAAQDWNSRDMRDYRRSALPFYHWLGTAVEGITSHATDDMKDAKDPATFIAKGMANSSAWFHAQAAQGYPWAKANPDKVEEHALTVMDPMWFADIPLKMLSEAYEGKEVMRLVPFAEKLIKGSQEANEYQIAGKPLAGRSFESPSTYAAIRSAVANGKTAEEVASLMFTLGFRTKEGFSLERSANPMLQSVGKFFKRTDAAFTPGFSEMMEKYQAIKERRLSADKLEQLTEQRQHIADLHDRIIENMEKYLGETQGLERERAAVAKKAQAVEGASKAVLSTSDKEARAAADLGDASGALGRALDERFGTDNLKDALNHFKEVNRLEFDRAMEKLPQLTQDQKNIIDWIEHNVPRDSEYPLKSYRDNLMKLQRAGKAPAVDEATLNAADAYIGALSRGYREGTEYRQAYGSSARAAMRVNLGLDPLPPADLEHRVWRMKQMSQGTIDSVENFQRWHAEVATREKMADDAAKLREGIKGLIAQKNESLAKALSLQEDTARALEAKNIAIKDWEQAVKAFQSDQPLTLARIVGRREAGKLLIANKAEREEVIKLVSEGLKRQSEIEAMKNEIEFAGMYDRDLESFLKSPEFVQYKATRSVNPVVAAWDAALAALRMATFKFTPLFIVHRMIDAGIVKPLLETGDTHLGPVLQSFLSFEPEAARDVFGRQMHFGSSFDRALDPLKRSAEPEFSRLGAAEQELHNYIGKHHYNQHVEKLVQQGVTDMHAVHKFALDKADEAVRLAQGAYRGDSPFTQILDRTTFVGRHWLTRNAYTLTKMLEHPAEASAFLKIEQARQEQSVDGRGALKLPFVGYAADPFAGVIPNQVANVLLHTGDMLTPQQSRDFIPGMTIRLITGDYAPGVKTLMQKMGAIPDSQVKELPFEQVYNSLAQAAGMPALRPSDAVSSFLGYDPEEKRDGYDARRTALYQEAARRDGQPIDLPAAKAQASRDEALSHMVNFLTTARVVPDTPGFRSVKEDADRYRNLSLQVPADKIHDLRQTFLTMPGNENLGAILPKAPVDSLNGANYILNQQKAAAEARLDNPMLDAKTISNPITDEVDRKNRFDTGTDILKQTWLGRMGSAMGRIFDTFVPNAGATEFSGQHPKDMKYTVDGDGHVLAAVDRSMTNEQVIDAANANNDIRLLETGMARHSRSAGELGKYLDTFNRPDGYNWAKDYLTKARDLSPQMAAYESQYRYHYSAGKEGGDDMPPQTAQAMRTFISARKSWIESAPSVMEATARSKANLPEIANAMANGSFKIPGGYTSVDQRWLDLARLEDSGSLYRNKTIVQSNRQAQWPADDLWTQRLEYENKASQNSVHNSVDAIIAGQKAGTVSPNFWSHMQTVHGQLYTDTMIHDRESELQLVQSQLFPQGARGPLNVMRLADLLDQPHGAPYVQMLRLYGDRDVQAQLNAYANTPLHLNNPPTDGPPTLDHLAPADPTALDHTFGMDFLYRTRQAAYPLEHILRGEDPSALAAQPLTASVSAFHPTEKEPVDMVTAPAKQTFDAKLSEPVTGAKPSIPTTQVPFATARMFQQPAPIISAPVPQLPTMPMGAGPETLMAFRDFRQQSLAQSRMIEQQYGHPVGSLTPSYWSDLESFSSNADGSPTMTMGAKAQLVMAGIGLGGPAASGQPATPVQDIHAAVTLASMADRLAGDNNPNSAAHRVIGGVSGAMSGLVAGATIGSFAGPIGTAVGAGIGLAVGAISGSMGSKAHHYDNTAYLQEQDRRNQIAEQNLEMNKERFEVSSLNNRERALAQASAARPAFAPRVQLNPYAFHPTFASRIGIVDQMERSLGSQLAPRW